MHEAMAELPENCQQILDRFFARDESYRTIGDNLGLPGRDDREPHLALPRQAPRRASREEIAPPAPSGGQVT